jgi:hypothetical protein
MVEPFTPGAHHLGRSSSISSSYFRVARNRNQGYTERCSRRAKKVSSLDSSSRGLQTDDRARSRLSSAISKEVPLVLSTVVETLTSPGPDPAELEAAFKCLEAYIEWGLTSEWVTNQCDAISTQSLTILSLHVAERSPTSYRPCSDC